MLRPGLGQALEFSIGWCACWQPQKLPRCPHLGDPIVRLDSVHLVEIEGEQACLANLLQLLVAHLEIDNRWRGEDGSRPVRKVQRGPASSGAVIRSCNSAALNHRVMQC